MASLNLSPHDDLKALESCRQKLNTLVASINSLRESIAQSHPLPAPSSIETSASILLKNIQSIHDVAAANSDLFHRVVVHPSANFPGRNQGHILEQLLRKKLEPDVQSQVEAAREAATSAGIGPHSFVSHRARRQRDDEEDDDEDAEYQPEGDDDEEMGGGGGATQPEPLGLGDVWQVALDSVQDRVRSFVTEENHAVYTVDERAMGLGNARTGLRYAAEKYEPEPELESDGEEEEDDDDDEQDQDIVLLDQPSTQQQQVQQQQQAPPPAAPSIDPEVAVWFAGRGDVNLPHNVERLSRVRASTGFPPM